MKYTGVVLVLLVFVLQLASSKPSVQGNPQTMCKLPEVRGHCRALLPRWRYDPAIGKCREFKFGGCDGNENNFVSEKACMSTCAGIR